MDKCREEFQKAFPIPAHWIEFDEKANRYYCPYVADATASAYQSKWVVWQYQQAKVEELEKEWLEMNQELEKYGVFLKAVFVLFQSTFLNQEELYLTGKKLQIYLADHPVRNELLKLAYQRKLFEKPVMTIDLNQLNIESFNEAFKNGSGFMQVSELGLRYLSKEEVVKPIEFPHQP